MDVEPFYHHNMSMSNSDAATSEHSGIRQLRSDAVHVEDLIETYDLDTVLAFAVMQLEPLTYEEEEGPATARTVLADTPTVRVPEAETVPAPAAQKVA